MTPTLEKPPIGAPCNACGLCCRIATCRIGSYAMSLVDVLGERAAGPCRALVSHADGRQTCGLLERPRDHAPRLVGGVADLRRAIALVIGAGAGCDEMGDEDPSTGDPALDRVTSEYIRRHGREALNAAGALIVHARRKKEGRG